MTHDWSPVGAPGDLAGDVAAIATTRRHHEVFADTFAAKRDALARIRPDDLWVGAAADRFVAARDRLRHALDRLAARSDAVVTALWSWAHTVEDVQVRGLHARDRARDALADLERAWIAGDEVDQPLATDARARIARAERRRDHGGKPKFMTYTEADALHDMRYIDVGVMRHVHHIAMSAAIERFPVQGHDLRDPSNDDHQDAFRHAYWTALIARRFGQDFARWFTTVHEGIPGNGREREAMDLHNNRAGLDIQATHRDADDERLADLVEEAVTDGRLVVITGREHLAWTDDASPMDVVDLDEDHTLDGHEPGHIEVPRAAPDFLGPERHVLDILP